MKGFYIENFALRLILCIVGMFALWFAIQFIKHSFILHDSMTISAFDIVVPLVGGIAQALAWKPKDKWHSLGRSGTVPCCP